MSAQSSRQPVQAETPEFFPNRERARLFGVLHPVMDQAQHSGVAVVYCAPLFEEKLWSHRVMVNFARFLAARGTPVLRFDYCGDGESEGEFREASIDSRVADTCSAVAHAGERFGVDRIILLGLGVGAMIAAAAARNLDEVAGLAMWAPIASGSRLLNDMLRMHLTAQMVVHRKVIHDREALVRQIMAGGQVNVEGYDIARPLYEQLAAIELEAMLAVISVGTLVVQISPQDRTEGQYAGLERPTRQDMQFRRVQEHKFWVQQRAVFPSCQELFGVTHEWMKAI